ncbi:MAG TPA: sigma-70 family RNA polymerase sigma factor [Opitutaceae bacterium]|nr:sigma-70 family RNA polymerase sigma factor [Opitutaceae bacterium]
MTDHELLRRYVQEGVQDAFGELVRRHVNLVYSAARRQVRSTQLAEEVSQSVFVDLARNARRLRVDQPLGAWLYIVTRRTAIDVVRRESRRQAREQTAVEIAAMNSTPSPWPQVEPLLDEAMESLGDADRRAVILRFFENQPLRDVGLTLGISEDAAQKRVSRAIEQLRTFFAKRRVAVGSAALAIELSTHAVQAAPAVLGATIASTAATLGSAAGSAAIHGTAKTIAMTATQKILAAAALTVAVVTGLYEAHVISRQNAGLQALRESSRRERADNARELAAVLQKTTVERAKVSTALASIDPAMESEMEAWLQKVVRLKQRLEQMPEKKIPELKVLTEQDWLDATKNSKLDSDMDVRRALNELRFFAKERLVAPLGIAFQNYLKANNNQPPSDATQLEPYFDPPVALTTTVKGDDNNQLPRDPTQLMSFFAAADARAKKSIALEILQRYGAPSAEQTKYLPPAQDGTPWIFCEKTAVDDYYDTTVCVSSGGTLSLRTFSKFGNEVQAAIKMFSDGHNGHVPTEPSQLAPYLHSAIDPAYLQEQLAGLEDEKSPQPVSAEAAAPPP